MQNSQCVRDVKPGTAPMVRRRVNARANFAGCQAVHRADGAAARWGHRALPPSRTREGARRGERRGHRAGAPPNPASGTARAGGWRAATRGGAMGTSRPTAKPHEGGCTATVHGVRGVGAWAWGTGVRGVGAWA